MGSTNFANTLTTMFAKFLSLISIAIAAVVAICAGGIAHADWDSALHDCLSDHNKALHLRHRECFAHELAKLPQQTRAEHGEIIRIMTGTAAIEDKNDAKDDADERAGVQRMPDPLKALVDCLSDDRFLHLHLHHHECAIREEAKLAQQAREERGEFIRQTIELAAKLDKTDASEHEIDRIDATRKMREERQAQFDAIKTLDGLAAWAARYCSAHGEPRVGMTEMEVRESTTWCLPSSINETVTADHTRRQYVFHKDTPGSGGHDGFLYFENSRLVAIQRHD